MSVVERRGIDTDVEVVVKSRVPQICRDALGEIACPNAVMEVETIMDEASQFGYGAEWAFLESRKRIGEMCANFCTQVGIPQQELEEKYQGVELDDDTTLPKLVALE